VTEAAQMELKSERVLAHACSDAGEPGSAPVAPAATVSAKLNSSNASPSSRAELPRPLPPPPPRVVNAPGGVWGGFTGERNGTPPSSVFPRESRMSASGTPSPPEERGNGPRGGGGGGGAVIASASAEAAASESRCTSQRRRWQGPYQSCSPRQSMSSSNANLVRGCHSRVRGCCLIQ